MAPLYLLLTADQMAVVAAGIWVAGTSWVAVMAVQFANRYRSTVERSTSERSPALSDVDRWAVGSSAYRPGADQSEGSPDPAPVPSWAGAADSPAP